MIMDGNGHAHEPAGTPKGGQFAPKAGMNNDMDLNGPPVSYENGELLLSDQWQPAAANTLNPDDTTHTYINHGEIIEFSHHIFENDDVVEEIYGVGYTDGIDSIAMRDWRGVGRDASLTMSAHITDMDIRRAVRQARQTAERHAPEYDGQPLALDYVELQSNSKDDPHIIAHYKPVIEKPGFHPVENARIQAFNKRLQPATIGLKPEDYTAFHLHTKEN